METISDAINNKFGMDFMNHIDPLVYEELLGAGLAGYTDIEIVETLADPRFPGIDFGTQILMHRGKENFYGAKNTNYVNGTASEVLSFNPERPSSPLVSRKNNVAKKLMFLDMSTEVVGEEYVEAIREASTTADLNRVFMTIIIENPKLHEGALEDLNKIGRTLSEYTNDSKANPLSSAINKLDTMVRKSQNAREVLQSNKKEI